VPESDIARFVRENKITYVQTSAKTGEGVEEAFAAMLKQISEEAQTLLGEHKTGSFVLKSAKLSESDKKKKKCC
jgi:GTPase SAR1 family protein